jgi:hypothetical protein
MILYLSDDCSEFSAASDGQTICITTLSQVSAYYVDSTDGFSADLETAIMSTDFGIDGLVVASSLATQSPDGTPSVPEGEGNPPDQDDIGVDNDDGVSGIEEPSNVQPGSTGITAGAAVGVAFAVLVVALALIFVRQRSYRNSVRCHKYTARIHHERWCRRRHYPPCSGYDWQSSCSSNRICTQGR